MSTKLYKSKKWMMRKYIVERLTEWEIADLAGTSQATIHRWLKKHGIERVL